MATRKGKIRYIHDAGSIIQLYLDTKEGTRVVAGDGNMTRRALHAAFGVYPPVGRWIEYEVESWGGMSWFAPTDEEEPRGNDSKSHPRNRRRK